MHKGNIANAIEYLQDKDLRPDSIYLKNQKRPFLL